MFRCVQLCLVFFNFQIVFEHVLRQFLQRAFPFLKRRVKLSQRQQSGVVQIHLLYNTILGHFTQKQIKQRLQREPLDIFPKKQGHFPLLQLIYEFLRSHRDLRHVRFQSLSSQHSRKVLPSRFVLRAALFQRTVLRV